MEKKKNTEMIKPNIKDSMLMFIKQKEIVLDEHKLEVKEAEEKMENIIDEIPKPKVKNKKKSEVEVCNLLYVVYLSNFKKLKIKSINERISLKGLISNILTESKKEKIDVTELKNYIISKKGESVKDIRANKDEYIETQNKAFKYDVTTKGLINYLISKSFE